MPIDYMALSKEISYALRHAPQEYGLTLDEQGWTPTDGLIAALKQQPKYAQLTAQDITRMIEASEKKRHEMDGGRIRALYGHSTQEKIQRDAVPPPELLYHGTARKFLGNILAQGLIPKDRQFVHLSEDETTALAVGRRRDEEPALLRIDAAAAHRDGIAFYHGNETVWLADHVPARYIQVL